MVDRDGAAAWVQQDGRRRGPADGKGRQGHGRDGSRRRTAPGAGDRLHQRPAVSGRAACGHAERRHAGLSPLDDAAAARGAVAGGQEPAHAGQDGRLGPEPAGVPAVFTL